MVNPISYKYDFTNLLYAYDVNTKVWNTPKTTGVTPINRRDGSAVVDDKGKMYIFGGSTGKPTGSPTVQAFNDMYILNTVDLNWSLASATNSPLATSDHTSTLLPDGRIVIIGGREGNSQALVNMNIVCIYFNFFENINNFF